MKLIEQLNDFEIIGDCMLASDSRSIASRIKNNKKIKDIKDNLNKIRITKLYKYAITLLDIPRNPNLFNVNDVIIAVIYYLLIDTKYQLILMNNINLINWDGSWYMPTAIGFL